MTLGTNASLEEQILYAPQEINYDVIVEALAELEEWRELLNALEYSVDDVKERIAGYENEIAEKDKSIETLEEELADAHNEIERLKEAIDDLIASD